VSCGNINVTDGWTVVHCTLHLICTSPLDLINIVGVVILTIPMILTIHVLKTLIISFSRWICFWQFYQNCFNSAAACDLRYICYMIFDSQSVHNCNHNMRCFAVCMYLMYLCNVYCNKYSLLNCSSGATVATLQYLCAWSKTTSNNELHWCKGTNHKYFTEKYLYKSTRCSAIAEIPRCRVRYSFRQK